MNLREQWVFLKTAADWSRKMDSHLRIAAQILQKGVGKSPTAKINHVAMAIEELETLVSIAKHADDPESMRALTKSELWQAVNTLNRAREILGHMGRRSL